MGKVAPHEGVEVIAVMNGYKPFSVIEFSKDSSGYSMAVSLAATGMLTAAVNPTSDCDMGEVAFTRPANRNMINQYNWLLRHGIEAHGLTGYHWRMGRLFGYSDADIEAFIATNIDCQCDKCTGNHDLN